ncbi:adventurous gliding motility protein GltC [Anaeromyxobacter oryzisoli]|uniref:adventurous gliding motility protein GltC n=1 Tax=Anaeromyxobacter oryzisoli TaxID=2925408 RepID=UPI001F55AAE0|nr:adventurous gliding motility protein GltC [Anaeromyxobacter sp. SG63]
MRAPILCFRPSRRPLVRAGALARLALLAVLLGVAGEAHAQLGIDLSAPAPQGEKASKKVKKAPKQAPAAPAPAPAQDAAPHAGTSPAAPPPAARPARPAPADDGLGIDLGKAAAASGAAKERLDAAKRLFQAGASDTAAIAFDEILRDPAMVPVHDEARYQLGKALVRLGLNHSALATFDQILDQGQASRFYGSAMEWLFYVGKRLRNEQPLVSRVARHARDAFPPGYEDKFHFLLARYEFERGRALQDAGRAGEAKTAWDEARRLASLVREQAGATPTPAGEAPAVDEGDIYAKARFVDGLILYAEGDAQGATNAFKDVVRLTNPKRGRHADPELRELSFLQLARIHYESRQNRYAIFYYGKMPWGGESWLEGLWEASYAHYRIGDYEKTLGNLLTLQSPYFKDDYFPESYVLKSIVYYENCRYPEARLVLETFSGIYEPVYEELGRITAGDQANTYYYDLISDARRQGSGITRKIMNLAFTDQNVRRLAESIREVDDEVDVGLGGLRPQFRETALAKRLAEALAAEKRALVEEAGARARAKLEWERDGLRTLLAQALRIKIEVSRKEREALEGSLAKGSQVEVVRDLKYSHAVSDEHLYWPYEGEFWRDELGTYSYTLTKGCKDRLPRTDARPAAQP